MPVRKSLTLFDAASEDSLIFWMQCIFYRCHDESQFECVVVDVNVVAADVDVNVVAVVVDVDVNVVAVGAVVNVVVDVDVGSSNLKLLLKCNSRITSTEPN